MASFFYAPLGFIYEKYFLSSSNIKQTVVKIRPDQTIQFQYFQDKFACSKHLQTQLSTKEQPSTCHINHYYEQPSVKAFLENLSALQSLALCLTIAA